MGHDFILWNFAIHVHSRWKYDSNLRTTFIKIPTRLYHRNYRGAMDRCEKDKKRRHHPKGQCLTLKNIITQERV